MITGEVKNKIDTIWDAFWNAGVTNPITVLEQMTYLFFIKMLDDSQIKKEANAQVFGAEVKDPVFKKGNWKNPETEKEVAYNDMRWSVFKNFDTTVMFRTVRDDVFVFIKNIHTGKDSAFSRYIGKNG